MGLKPSDDQYWQSIAKLQKKHEDKGESCIRKQSLPNPDDSFFVDIIIPAYNAEKYIVRCAQSVFRQKTKFPFRVILVDDGSKDHTGELIDRYRNRENALIIHQDNRGLSGARNTGLLYSQSKYILFLDSDDLLGENAVESLVSRCDKEHADIVAGSYCNFRGIPLLRRKHSQAEGIIHSWLDDLTGHACTKIYRRELFDKIQFPEGYWFEDSLMHQVVFPQARTIFGIRDVVYVRRMNPNSITQKAEFSSKSLDSLWVTLRLMEDRRELGLDTDDLYYRYLLRQTRLNHVRLKGMERIIQEAAFTVMAVRLNKLYPEMHAQATEEAEIEKTIKEYSFEQFEKLCI